MAETEASPILPLTSKSTLRVRSRDWASHLISITFTELIRVSHSTLYEALTDVSDTPLEESIPALDEIRKAGKTKYIGLSECSAKTLRKADSSKSFMNFLSGH